MRKPTILAGWWTTMTGGLILQCSGSLISNGDHTQLIGLPMCTTVRWKDSICAIGTQVQRQWMPSHAIGVVVSSPILNSSSFKTCSGHQSGRYIGGPPVVLSAILAIVIFRWDPPSQVYKRNYGSPDVGVSYSARNFRFIPIQWDAQHKSLGPAA